MNTKNIKDVVSEQQTKVQSKLTKVKQMPSSVSRNSALILLQQSQSFAAAGDVKKSRQLYAKALECLEFNLTYI